MIILSVIITNHNQSKEIADLLARIRNDNLRRCEIIVIDDVSEISDYKNICEICERFYSQRLVECKWSQVTNTRLNEWGSAGGARNRGAHIAGGDYLWFVDGDDEIVPGAVERIVRFLDDNSPDILLLPHSERKGNDMRVHQLDEDVSCPQPFMWRIAPWGKVIKKEIFTKFVEKCWYEDTDWHFRQCDAALTRAMLPGRPAYIYNMSTCDDEHQMSGIARLEKAATDNVPLNKLLLEDEKARKSVGERLAMIARIVKDLGSIRNKNIREYAAQFVSLMIETMR